MPSDCLHVGGFRVSFTPLTGVLFTVPSRYSSAIGRRRYLALEGGPPCFRRPSTGAAVLPISSHQVPLPSPTGLSPAPGTLSSRLLLAQNHPAAGLWPSPDARLPPRRVGHSPLPRRRFRLFPVRSPLLGESVSFPRGTKMFQFPRFPPSGLYIQPAVLSRHGERVPPFGYLRLIARSTTPRSFSQCAAPFFGLRRQGIHHQRLFAYGSSVAALTACIATHAHCNAMSRLPVEAAPAGPDPERDPSLTTGPAIARQRATPMHVAHAMSL
jgi:hypothetical protein